MYCEQTIEPPAASAEKAWISRILMESTRDTADIATGPTLLIISVSAIPIRQFKSCSIISGISNARIWALLNICFVYLLFIFLFFIINRSSLLPYFLANCSLTASAAAIFA